MAFAASKPGRRALTALLEKAEDGIEGRAGTVIAYAYERQGVDAMKKAVSTNHAPAAASPLAAVPR